MKMKKLFGLSVMVVAFCLLAPAVFSQASQFNYSAPMYFRHNVELDSVIAILSDPGGNNLADTIVLLPTTADSTVARYDSLLLDSIGTFPVTLQWWERDAGSVSGVDSFYVWTNTKPTYYTVTGTDTVSATDKVCVVVISVIGSDGQARRGVRCSAYPVGRNLKDSSGAIVSPSAQREKSDQYGRLIFNCLWSSYMVPATNWHFQFRGSDIEALSFDYAVPRQTTDTIVLGDLP